MKKHPPKKPMPMSKHAPAKSMPMASRKPAKPHGKMTKQDYPDSGD